MARIPKEVQEFVKNKIAWVATASPDGVPNTTPKGTVRFIDDERIVFADLFSRKTRDNLQKNPKIAVAVMDLEKRQGYQFKGSAQLVDSGPIFDQVVEQLKKAPMQLPHPKYVVIINVDSVFDQSIGPKAGQQIA